MNKETLKKLLDTAAGRIPADTVIKNCKIVNVFTKKVEEGSIAISDGIIAGIGDYQGHMTVDAEGRYAIPGLIDSHIHIESSYLCPEEIGRLLVPHGTTTIIADPHEIVNVCGIRGLDYMMEAAKNTALDILYMLPSCVPSTPFEHAGAVINAPEMEEPIQRDKILGLGEFMNYPGVIQGDDMVLDKLLTAKKAGKLIDGHSPGLCGNDLNAYAAAGILADHECSTREEMEDRLARGMYVMLRQGSACHNLQELAPYVTEANSRRCLLCSDDRQPKTIFTLGHVDGHLRLCVEKGIPALTAIQMATLNAAECFGLHDRGALAPGRRADVVLVDDLQEFRVNRVWIEGRLTAQDSHYLPTVPHFPIDTVRGSVIVRDFSKDKLKMHLKSGHVNAIEILPGGVVTGKSVVDVQLDADGEFCYSPQQDVVKVAVIERHQGTGNVSCGFLKGYGIKSGAVALSIAHDSHNIIAAGISDEEIAFAVQQLIAQEGGIILVKDGAILESMPLPIAGLMTDRDGKWVDEKLTAIHEKAFQELGIHGDVEPVMTLCFMSLPVIPALKLTDIGLFDVTQFKFIPIEAE